MPRGSEIVLVVDDNPRIRTIIVNQLSNLGYTTLEAESAAGGLDVLERGANIGLLLSDVIIPGGMNGYELGGAARRPRPNPKSLVLARCASPSVHHPSGGILRPRDEMELR